MRWITMSEKLSDIQTNFPEWYHDVVYKAELADQAPVRGCMVIRPYGYALWENIRDILDKKIKDTGHQNAYFPLFIPKSFLEKEAKHVEGFAPELAIVTHAGGKELEEPLVVRPTSETIIHYMFAQWIKSWRDLPMKINNWSNVVRWEMRTRPFLRTTEFLWQEGHTAHETEQEAQDEAELMLNEYYDLIKNYCAIPAVKGRKSESEKFAGADTTYTIEAMMQDGKALQMCTSHIISRNFSRAFGITFQTREGNLDHPYLTSWGFTTRSIGAMVMVHGDQKGLIIPPKIAPIQLVIIPIFKTDDDKNALLETVKTIALRLKTVARITIDADENKRPGEKFYTWELKGVPLRVEIGPRDLKNGTVVLADRLGIAKETILIDALIEAVQFRLELVQQKMLERAEERLKSQWHHGDKLVSFGKKIEEVGGFWQTGWCRDANCELKLKEYKATIRCLLEESSAAVCFACDKKSEGDILIAKSY
jgi:prolyl-tRNA synthetase